MRLLAFLFIAAVGIAGQASAEMSSTTDTTSLYAKARMYAASFSSTAPSNAQVAPQPRGDFDVSANSTAKNLAKIGLDLFDSRPLGSQIERVRLRGGISGVSTRAAAGVQLIVNW